MTIMRTTIATTQKYTATSMVYPSCGLPRKCSRRVINAKSAAVIHVDTVKSTLCPPVKVPRTRTTA